MNTKKKAVVPDLPDGIRYISKAELNAMLENGTEGNYEPRGLFVLADGDGTHQTAIDNRNGGAWVEDFDTLEDAVVWLGGALKWAMDEDFDSDVGPSEPDAEPPRFAKALARYIDADAGEVEGAYALERARSFGLADSDLSELGFGWLLDLDQNR